MIIFISSSPNIPPSPPCGLRAETPILGFKNPHDFKEEFVSLIVFKIFFLLISRLTFFIAACVVTRTTLNPPFPPFSKGGYRGDFGGDARAFKSHSRRGGTVK